ncbi:CO dehydrogenase/acetyl-CoA synthase subunit delta [Candidatus Omnitrophota bacterium]
MAVELLKEKWSSSIVEVTLGATKAEGGTRSSVIKIGGESTLPFLFNEGAMPHSPVVAMEVHDVAPVDWPDVLKKPFGDSLSSPAEWAEKCVKEFGAEAICLKLQGTHPDSENRDPEKAAVTVREVLKAVSVPLIILGCGDDDKDNAVLPKCSEAAKGEKCLIGSATQDSYRTLAASCLADGHSIIAESPIDINIAKQLNILISDMGITPERIVIDPTIGALGYGLEYGYSIMERARLAALSGDKMLAMPFFCKVGQEAWRAKEAKALSAEFPDWGDENKRGPAWEIITAATVLQAGADLLVMRHPKAVAEVKGLIQNLMKG